MVIMKIVHWSRGDTVVTLAKIHDFIVRVGKKNNIVFSFLRSPNLAAISAKWCSCNKGYHEQKCVYVEEKQYHPRYCETPRAFN